MNERFIEWVEKTPNAMAKGIETREANRRRAVAIDQNRSRLRQQVSDANLKELMRKAAAYDRLMEDAERKKRVRANSVALKKKRVADSDRKLSFLKHLTTEDLGHIDAWIYQNSLTNDGGVLQRNDLIDHLRAEYKLDLSPPQASQLMHKLSYEWGTVTPGYYYARRQDPLVLNHRNKIAPLMEFFLTNTDLFLVCFQDEKAFRTESIAEKKWIKQGDKFHAMDTTQRSTGVGDGINVSAGLTRKGALLYDDKEYVGYEKTTKKKANREAASKTTADASSKETAKEFVDVVDSLAERLRQLAADTGKVPVIFIDGARTHIAFAPGSPRVKTLSAWNKAQLLTFLGDDVEDPRAPNRGLVEEVRRHPRYRDELMWVEQVCATQDVLVLILPNAHPQWNPIERFWRFIQCHFRSLPPRERTYNKLVEHVRIYMADHDVLQEHSKNVPKALKPMRHIDKWFLLSLRYVRWAAANPSSGKYPTEHEMMRMDPNPVPTDVWTENFGTGEKLRANLEELKMVLHYYNMHRREPASGRKYDNEIANKYGI